jgi:serine/threonine protein phosphatase PrpC
MQMKVYATSDVGKVREINEDYFSVSYPEDKVQLFLLADGMGGLSLGDMAADVVTKSIADYIKSNYKGSDDQKVLHEALDYADKKLRNVSMTNKSNMGAAVAVVIVHDHHLYCTWQGNVRVYVQHDNKLSLITEDHIANIGYGRTALTRCIKGAGLRDDVPFVSHELINDDAVILCTDGLYSVTESDMASSSVDEIKARIVSPEDDASLIKISSL